MEATARGERPWAPYLLHGSENSSNNYVNLSWKTSDSAHGATFMVFRSDRKQWSGYDPFTFDITGYIQSDETQTIEVTAWDPTDQGYQPVGKQSLNPRGIWYTAVTDIWQTVWLEYVPQSYI